LAESIDIRVLSSLRSVNPRAWNDLVGHDDPFVEHAFLSLLEESESVGRGSGWEPTHVTAWRGKRLVGALPLYLKTHSYGEYIFDWGWADAASRRIIDACLDVADDTKASSIHLLFLSPEEQSWVAADGRLMKRLSFQFHWHNHGYESFDDFVGDFRSSMRKKLRKERRVASESELEIAKLEGSEITPGDWLTLERLYRATCGRKGSYPYLTRAFFELAPKVLDGTPLVFAARDRGRIVAASLNFAKGTHLYGRYWGATERHDMLHFELCYYRLIEHAIERRMDRFEAGAQGTHKLRRGLMPVPIHSAHWVRHPVLAQAVADFLPREAASVEQQIRELALHGPFRRDPRRHDDLRASG